MGETPRRHWIIDGPAGTPAIGCTYDRGDALDSEPGCRFREVLTGNECPVCHRTDERDPRPHIKNGEFQSDKYAWCKPGFVPLKLTDPMAQPVLAMYAEARRSIDAEFSDDLLEGLRLKGYFGKADSELRACQVELAETKQSLHMAREGNSRAYADRCRELEVEKRRREAYQTGMAALAKDVEVLDVARNEALAEVHELLKQIDALVSGRDKFVANDALRAAIADLFATHTDLALPSGDPIEAVRALGAALQSADAEGWNRAIRRASRIAANGSETRSIYDVANEIAREPYDKEKT